MNYLIFTHQGWYSLYMKDCQVSTLWEESLPQIHSYLPHHSTINLRMVNLREPVAASGTRSTCASQRFLRLRRSPDQLEHSSYTPVLLASCGWFLYVGLPPIGHFAFPMCCISISYLQLGISGHSRLGMECHPRAPPTPMDNMGLLSFSLFLSVLRHVSDQQSDLFIW
jgi:hypothetical protein